MALVGTARGAAQKADIEDGGEGSGMWEEEHMLAIRQNIDYALAQHELDFTKLAQDVQVPGLAPGKLDTFAVTMLTYEESNAAMRAIQRSEKRQVAVPQRQTPNRAVPGGEMRFRGEINGRRFEAFVASDSQRAAHLLAAKEERAAHPERRAATTAMQLHRGGGQKNRPIAKPAPPSVLVNLAGIWQFRQDPIDEKLAATAPVGKTLYGMMVTGPERTTIEAEEKSRSFMRGIIETRTEALRRIAQPMVTAVPPLTEPASATGTRAVGGSTMSAGASAQQKSTRTNRPRSVAAGPTPMDIVETASSTTRPLESATEQAGSEASPSGTPTSQDAGRAAAKVSPVSVSARNAEYARITRQTMDNLQDSQQLQTHRITGPGIIAKVPTSVTYRAASGNTLNWHEANDAAVPKARRARRAHLPGEGSIRMGAGAIAEQPPLSEVVRRPPPTAAAAPPAPLALPAAPPIPAPSRVFAHTAPPPAPPALSLSRGLGAAPPPARPVAHEYGVALSLNALPMQVRPPGRLPPSTPPPPSSSMPSPMTTPMSIDATSTNTASPFSGYPSPASVTPPAMSAVSLAPRPVESNNAPGGGPFGWGQIEHLAAQARIEHAQLERRLGAVRQRLQGHLKDATEPSERVALEQSYTTIIKNLELEMAQALGRFQAFEAAAISLRPIPLQAQPPAPAIQLETAQNKPFI